MNFDYINLNEIDPNVSVLPEGGYVLKVLKAEKREFVYKKGDKAGQNGQLISLQLAVADHPEYSGRRLFESLFPSNYSFRILRRVADAVGIMQEPGEAIDEWLAAMTEQQPNLRVPVGYRTDREGKVILGPTGKPAENAVDWFNVQPV